MADWFDKLLGVLKSRRFKAAIVAVLVILFQDWLSLEAEKAEWIASILMAWIVGDSVKTTGTFSGKKLK